MGNDEIDTELRRQTRIVRSEWLRARQEDQNRALLLFLLIIFGGPIMVGTLMLASDSRTIPALMIGLVVAGLVLLGPIGLIALWVARHDVARKVESQPAALVPIIIVGIFCAFVSGPFLIPTLLVIASWEYRRQLMTRLRHVASRLRNHLANDRSSQGEGRS